jgi:hypothetical protein
MVDDYEKGDGRVSVEEVVCQAGRLDSPPAMLGR